MTGKPGNSAKDGKTTETASGFSLPFADSSSLSAMMGNPAAVMAAATAMGMSFSAQMANAFFGMAKAALDASQPSASQKKASDTVASPAQPAPVSEPTAAAEAVVVPLKPKAVRKIEPSEAVALASAARKASPVKAKSAKAVAAEPAPVKPGRVGKAAEAPAPSPAKAKTVPANKAAPAKVKTKADLPATVEPTKPSASKSAPAKTKAAARKKADDLKKISGVGPKLENLLNGLGVLRFKDIAAWTEKDVQHFDQELGLDGRIAKDDWIAQAKALLR